MNRVLFLGNGLNRIDESSGYSWINLLDVLERLSKLDSIDHSNKPFPILYEEIYLQGYRQFKIDESELLKRVQHEISKLKPNSLYHQLDEVKFDTFITTNYDYLIEECLSKERFSTVVTYGMKAETKYRIRTKNIVEEKSIWHIHGENNYRHSLVLGQKMYSEVVSRISQYIENDMNQEKKSWIDHLYQDEVHILGYGLSYDDISVWTVLTERARAIVEGHLKLNRVVFHHCIQSMTLKDQKAFKSLLEAHAIEVDFSQKEEDYAEFYQRVINQFKKG